MGAITTEFAQETLRDLLRAQQQAIGIPNIQKTVADYYGLQIKDLLSKRRTRSLARPRQVAMALTKELTEQLRRNRTIDWNHKESARAKMRVMVKRLLKKHHYPPEGQEQALRTVMEQCNRWADDEDYYKEQKLFRVDDDRDVCNLIFNRLQLSPETPDAELQREIMEVFGERYPDMKIMDWKRIIGEYTPMVREAAQQPTAKVLEMQQRQWSRAAEGETYPFEE
jgi:hypothetical protein